MNIKDVTYVGYKSMAILWGISSNYWDIVKVFRKQAESKQSEYAPGSTENVRWEKIKDRWNDLAVRISWEMKYLNGSYGGYGLGVEKMLSQLWSYLGYDHKDLPAFSSYKHLPLLLPTTFKVEPPNNISSIEQQPISKEDTELRSPIRNEKEFQDRYITLFNGTVFRIYTSIGLGMWLNSVLDRDSADDYALDLWDIVLEGSRNFMYYSRSCLSESEASNVQYFDGKQTDTQEKMRIRAKYIRKHENTLTVNGGVYAINKSNIPEQYINSVNTLDDLND